MKRSFVLLTVFTAIVAIGFFVGCSKDDPTPGIGGSSDPTAVASIELRVSHTLISGILDEVRTEQITAIARNAAGVGIRGVRLEFGIVNPRSWKGTISTAEADTITDENGKIVANYSVVLEQNEDVEVYARTGQISSKKTIQLIVRESAGTLSMSAEKQVLAIAPDQTKSTNVTATMVDNEGLALPGVQIMFSTDPPTLGFVDSDTGTTDNSGRSTRRFTSIVNQYGTCRITGKVGTISDFTSIEIRPVAGPSAITIHADPQSMRVPQGQNATSTISAVVTDSTGVGVPRTTVLFELVGMGNNPIFGSMTSLDTTTNMDGEISTTFNSRGSFGQQWVVARVLPTGVDDGETQSIPVETGSLRLQIGDNIITGINQDDLSAKILITVEPLEDEPRSMSMSATPNFFNIPKDTTGYALIQATIRDAARNGIPNLRVDFSANFGTLSQPTYTDSSGVARVNFMVRPLTDLPDLVEPTTVTITASIPGTNWNASVDIEVVPTQGEGGSLTIETDRYFIWADGQGLSFANLVAVLKDEDGQVLSGKEIIFTSSFDYSVVQSPITTDSLGRAMTVFDDVGRSSVNDENEPDSVLVTAKYQPMALNASLRIMIRERNPVDLLVLTATARQLRANSGDSTNVRATCYLSDGSPAPAGTEVRFEAIYGSFSSAIVPVAGSAGAAETFYIAGRVVATDTLIAQVWTPQDTAISNEVLIDLISGPPSIITVRVFPTELITNDPTSIATVTATVLDTSGNPVREGTYVSFSTTLGTVTPSAITDNRGDAIAVLTAGVEAGVARITATSTGGITGEATVTFIAGRPHTIELTADPLQIAVKGTGGITTSTLRATVRDPNGNLVARSTSVVFMLINEPPPDAGCTIGDTGQVFISQTSMGVAVASLNSGEQIGGKLIRAYTWPDSLNNPERIVQVTLSTVAVVAGPPFQIDLDVNDEGTDIGGGSWAVEVSCRVWDSHRNPVANRIPVLFTVEPEIATIDPGYTGNDGGAGPVAGLAFSNMIYHSVNTFDQLEISAEVTTERGIIQGFREHRLALQEGQLELNVDPSNWMFEEGQEVAEITCWVVLNDGHEIEINNAPILFTVNRARFYWRDFANDRLVEYWPAVVRKYTGVIDQHHNEWPGHATVVLVATELDIFLDPFTLEVTVQVEATVEGYDDVSADPGFIFFTRHGVND